MYLNVLETFKCNFVKNYNSYLSSSLFSMLIKSNNIMNDYSNIYLHGNDSMILSLCQELLLEKILGSKIQPIKKHACQNINFDHYWHSNYFLIDINELTYVFKCNLMTFLKQLSCQDCLNEITPRHLIIIKNIDKLNVKFLTILKVFLEKQNILFVFLASKTIQWSKTNCLNVSCNINVYSKYDIILKNLNIKLDENDIHFYVSKSEGNICKFIILVENNKKEILLETFLEKSLNTMIKNKNKNDQRLISCIIETCNKLEVSGIPIDIVCKIIINILQSRKNKNMCIIIELLSNCELKIVKSNKQTYSLQELFCKLIAYL